MVMSPSAGIADFADIAPEIVARSRPAVSRMVQARIRMLASRPSSVSSWLVLRSTLFQRLWPVVTNADRTG